VRPGGREGNTLSSCFGKPLKEPIAWYGPIVMNTQEEIRQAMKDLRKIRLSNDEADYDFKMTF